MSEKESFTMWLDPRRWSGFTEACFAMVFILMLGSPILAMLVSPWILVITVPGGVLMMFHGYWRDNVKDET